MHVANMIVVWVLLRCVLSLLWRNAVGFWGWDMAGWGTLTGRSIVFGHTKLTCCSFNTFKLHIKQIVQLNTFAKFKMDYKWPILACFEPNSSGKLSVFAAKFRKTGCRCEVVGSAIILLDGSTSELRICEFFLLIQFSRWRGLIEP